MRNVETDLENHVMEEGPAWVAYMDDIRAAHLAEAKALESVVAAISSKQQACISALRRQVEGLTARISQITNVHKNVGGARSIRHDSIESERVSEGDENAADKEANKRDVRQDTEGLSWSADAYKRGQPRKQLEQG